MNKLVKYLIVLGTVVSLLTATYMCGISYGKHRIKNGSILAYGKSYDGLFQEEQLVFLEFEFKFRAQFSGTVYFCFIYKTELGDFVLWSPFRNESLNFENF
ncbi:hypothetical protein [Candidatus Uabimicrobium sp. HlEnr_7]|uniref:hypothetical protein n=1 Tax=Candidatus Uabimicrobium helgolandensis TaxID=3095367 RepID=UPI0035580082